MEALGYGFAKVHWHGIVEEERWATQLDPGYLMVPWTYMSGDTVLLTTTQQQEEDFFLQEDALRIKGQDSFPASTIRNF